MSAASVLRTELRQMLPPLVFFLFSFNLLALAVALLDPSGTISAGRHGAATLGALIVAKAVLLADHLPVVNRYGDRPLVWATIWKASLYEIVTLLLHGAERLVAAARQAGGLGPGWEALRAAFDWRAALAVHLLLGTLFLLFTAGREANRALGPGRLRTLFFGRSRPPPD